jgi:hypothetical protein
VLAGDAEDTFDAALVSHYDLNVSLLIKTGARINRLSLDKNALHGVHGWQALGVKDAVQAANHCAIKVPPEPVCTVCGQRDGAGSSASCQAVVCDSHPFDAGGSCQIEA